MMKQSFKIFYWGMMISFLGSLPPGLMNILGTQIFNSRGFGEAFMYVTGFMLTEAIVVRISLSAMGWLIRNRNFFRVLEWITTVMLIAVSLACFIAADSMQQIPSNKTGLLLPSFIMGAIISLVNPMHIPFWMGWSMVLLNKGILLPRTKLYNFYIVGISTGTIAGFITFIPGGAFVLDIFQSHQYLINCMIGFALGITAFFHIRKMIFVPVTVRHAKLFTHPN
ncbi:MAG TPA: LysE family transporter [Chitinophagaceae bacterium]|nr:LysE family transporter [Chitinophagaceae bacterium]